MKFKNYLIAFLSFLLLFAVANSWYLSYQLKRAKREISTITVDPLILKEKLAREPPDWMVKQIEKDLSAHPSHITSSMIDGAFHGEKIKHYGLVRFTITNGHITFSHDERHLYSRHFRELLACIETLNQYTKLPDVDFIVSLEDGYADNPGLGPCFVFAKKDEPNGLILVPDIKAMTGYGRLRGMIADATPKFPWIEKEPIAFWRGSSTGGYFTHSNWDHFARAKLVLFSLTQPYLLDARFHQIVQSEPGVRELMKSKGLLSNPVEKVDHLKYKFLVDVDGNSCSFERFFWLLASNSLVIKQVTSNIQWYYGALQPYKHYLPVKEDLSDLAEQISWAKEHDREAEEMAKQATAFVRDNLSSEDTLVYLYHLLVRYAAKF